LLEQLTAGTVIVAEMLLAGSLESHDASVPVVLVARVAIGARASSTIP
jgi:hypothetical protein